MQYDKLADLLLFRSTQQPHISGTGRTIKMTCDHFILEVQNYIYPGRISDLFVFLKVPSNHTLLEPVSNSCDMGQLNFHFYFISLPEFTPVYSGVGVTRSLVLCVSFVDRCLSLFFWPLCCLSFFDLRILITPFVSLNPSSRILSHTCILYCFFLMCSNNTFMEPKIMIARRKKK